MHQLFEKSKPYFFLFIVVIFGFWQISFLNQALKWDLIDVVFPFRFYFSECIQSGYFPFWNPYLQTGYPFFSDLQAPVFYPELLFTSLFTGYGIYTMHFWFMAYLFVAASGMYRLSFYFNKNRLASFVAGSAYALSGYIVGHGQHFFLLIGAAWIPFVIVSYLKLCSEKKIRHVFISAVFIFLMVSGAYQALSFTLMYLLILLFSYFIVKEIAQKNLKGIITLFKLNLLLSVVVVVFSLPLIFTTSEILNSVERLQSGVSPDQTIGFGLDLKSVISFLLPFSTLKNADFFGGADLSMRNLYFGIIPFLFFIAALLKKRTIPEYLLLGFGLVIFASSFAFLPVREFMFQHVPLMNLFKYAAYLNIFGLLVFILLAANHFSDFLKNAQKEKYHVLLSGTVFLTIILMLIVYSGRNVSLSDVQMLLKFKKFNQIIENTTFHQHIFFQAIIQFFILSTFLGVVLWRRKFKKPAFFFIALVVAELFISAQLNMGTTVTDSLQKPFQMKQNLALFPQNFPIPVNGKIIYNDEKHTSFQPFWRNTQVFTKQVSFDAFSSFELKSYSKLDDDYPNLRNAVLNNHLVYFSDSIFSLSKFNDSNINPQKHSNRLYLSEKNFEELSGRKVFTNKEDEIIIAKFSPNKITIETTTKNDQFLTMLQTNFKGWKAYIDDVETPVYTSNFNYRTIFLPTGNHTVNFEFKNNKILVFYYLSTIAFFTCLLILIGFVLKQNHMPNKTNFFVLTLIFLITAFFVFKRINYRDKNINTQQYFNDRWKTNEALFHADLDFENETQNVDTIISFTGNKSLRVSAENEYLNLAEIDIQKENFNSGTLVIRGKIFSENYPELLIVSDLSERDEQNQWHALKIENEIENLNKWNEIFYCRNFFNVKENNKIKTYLWNVKSSEFRIDDVSVEFYPLN